MNDDLLTQARLLVREPHKIRGHEGMECGLQCLEQHLLGVLNRPTFTGVDVMWGPRACGNLYGAWDLHANRYVRLTGSFPAPEGGLFTVDLSDALEGMYV